MSKTFAFFGATGGCTNACLAYTLLNGYNVIALARTPSKLTTQLLEQPGLTTSTLDKHLRIIQGDATDIEAVIQTLIVGENENKPPTLVSSIISGIGGTGIITYTKPSPCEKMKMRIPTMPHIELANPHITEEFAQTLVGALRRIADERFVNFDAYATVAPRVTVISSTGIKKELNDVPFWFKKMYDTLLPIPHEDKLKMEEVFEAEKSKEQSLLVGGLILVRPSFLSGDHLIPAPGKEDPYRKLRVGNEKKPAVGYTVHRTSIGRWIYEEVVKNGGDLWVGEGAILTE
ncbi:uncharacterized protein N7483_002644 [Penicillium malachiteum]|uniref:uncharacterized protein n=1 Tax=Penicillium malachiteum TaxID=1324776 RepID=UPI0025496BAD|nr:uncharacterized protein N7483_002644 [Penicillium malachiteum]KAJ5737519.1 hypothetical protein N7483_002644 [Penicillium malachiteum]